jgi:hypothetical protein
MGILVKKLFWVFSRVVWLCFRRHRRFEDHLCLHPQGCWAGVGLVGDPVLYLYLLWRATTGINIGLGLRKQNHTTVLKTRKNFFTRIVLFTGKTSKCVYSQLYGEDRNKPAQLTTNQRAEAALRGGRNRYKYRTGLPTRPTPTQQPWEWRQRWSSKRWCLRKQNHTTWLKTRKSSNCDAIYIYSVVWWWSTELKNL